MKEGNKIRSVQVFRGTATEAAMVKSLLENAEIQAYLKDDIYGTLAPWVTGAGGAGAVKVIVSSIDEKNAKLVVEDYEKNRNNTL